MNERDELVAYLRRTPGWSTLGNAAADQIERDGRENQDMKAKIAALEEWSVQSEIEAVKLRRENERLREALTNIQGLYQVTHCHAAARTALNGEGET